MFGIQWLQLASSRALAWYFQHLGLGVAVPGLIVAPPYMGSAQTRDRTHISCTGRQILYHCAHHPLPQEALCFSFTLTLTTLLTTHMRIFAPHRTVL